MKLYILHCHSIDMKISSPTLISLADNNECDQDPPPCHKFANCTNNPGNFSCNCNSGFTGDGLSDCTGKLLFWL